MRDNMQNEENKAKEQEMTDMNIAQAAQKYADYTIEMRRYFHMYPELGMEEENTSKKIREELTKMGVPFVEMAKYGTLATIGGKKPGKCVLLRADMDALLVQEENDFEYASKNPGVMHACGHDSHSAMLLGCARILKDMEDEINGTVKLCFQPSEENGKGAKLMIQDGALEGVDACFALHVWADVDSGYVAVAPGPIMAGANMFEIEIKGKASHGSAPHHGIDALTTGCAVVEELQKIVSREIDPQDPAVVTVGSFHSGTSWNIICDEAKLVGTTRCYSKEVNEMFPKAIERILEHVCAAHRCEGKLTYTPIVAPTINDTAMSELAQQSVAKVFGEGKLQYMRPTTGGEDFSEYIRDIPGAICMVGVRNPEIDGVYANHHGKFKVDEPEMVKGAGLYAQLAVDFLNK